MSTLGAQTALGTRPLEGKRIVLTRARAQAGDFEARISALGGEPVLAPAIAIRSPGIVDRRRRRPPAYRDLRLGRIHQRQRGARARRPSAGHRRGSRIREQQTTGCGRPRHRRRGQRQPAPARRGFVDADRGSTRARHRRRGECPDFLSTWATSRATRYPAGLRSRGAFVDDVIVYRTVPGEGIETIASLVRSGGADALLFASPSAVRFVADALAGDTCRREQSSLLHRPRHRRRRAFRRIRARSSSPSPRRRTTSSIDVCTMVRCAAATIEEQSRSERWKPSGRQAKSHLGRGRDACAEPRHFATR